LKWLRSWKWEGCSEEVGVEESRNAGSGDDGSRVVSGHNKALMPGSVTVSEERGLGVWRGYSTEEGKEGNVFGIALDFG